MTRFTLVTSSKNFKNYSWGFGVLGFWSLCLLGAILAQKENSFICEKKNLIFWHPWDPWGRIHIDLNKKSGWTGCVFCIDTRQSVPTHLSAEDLRLVHFIVRSCFWNENKNYWVVLAFGWEHTSLFRFGFLSTKQNKKSAGGKYSTIQSFVWIVPSRFLYSLIIHKSIIQTKVKYEWNIHIKLWNIKSDQNFLTTHFNWNMKQSCLGATFVLQFFATIQLPTSASELRKVLRLVLRNLDALFAGLKLKFS